MSDEKQPQSPAYRTSHRTEEAERMLHFPRIYKHFRLTIQELDREGVRYAVARAVPQKSMPAHLKKAIPLNHGVIVAACRESAYPSFKGASRGASDDVMSRIDQWIKRTEQAALKSGQQR